MTKEELIARLNGIEWDDFEVKEAQNKLPDNVWDTVSAFSNTSGGWIVFGVKQIGKRFEIQGISDGEKIESDFLNTLRSGQKFNTRISAEGHKYDIDGHLVLSFYIPSSSMKPVYVNNPIITFIRSGSGDRRASEGEIAAMQRDQAFGVKSEQLVVGTTLNDLDPVSLETFRNQIRGFNPEFPYTQMPTNEFCEKVGISKDGVLTYGVLLMWEEKRGSVEFTDDVVSSTITFRFEKQSVDDSHTTEVNEKVNEKANEKVNERQKLIISAILSNPRITQSELAKQLGISVVHVSKNMKKLQLQGIIRRIGPDKGGHWEIITDQQ